jgi:ParB-like chromosome segregation protein Spo0J
VSENQLKIRNVKLDVIKPYERNPRKNQAVDKVAASIQEYGFRQPIVVDAEMVIIAGHTRYQAAQQLGLETVPIHVATDLTPDQVRAYRLADNRTAEDAEWDKDLLMLEIGELRNFDFDLSLTGFDEKELKNLLKELDNPVKPEPVSRPEPENCPKCGQPLPQVRISSDG